MIRLGDLSAGAFAGQVDVGEKALALTAKLVGKENQPTIQVIAEIAQTAFQKFYKPPMSLHGLVGAVSPTGEAGIWKLIPAEYSMDLEPVASQGLIGDPKAKGIYKEMEILHWTKLQRLKLGQPQSIQDVIAIDISGRVNAVFDYTIKEYNRIDPTSTIGRPIQAVLINQNGGRNYGARVSDDGMDSWSRVDPTPGQVRARHRGKEFKGNRF